MSEIVDMSQHIKIVRRVVQCQCPHCHTQWTIDREVPDFFAPNGYGVLCCDSCAEAIKAKELIAAAAAKQKNIVDESNIPEEFCNWDPIVGNNNLARFIRDHREQSILLFGDFNVGKSRSCAYNLLLEVKEGRSGQFLKFKEALDRYSSLRQDSCAAALDYMRRLAALDLLVLDDFGKRTLNETAGEFAYDLINRFYEGKGRIWITSNDQSLAHMMQKFSNQDTGAAVASRIDRMVDANRMIIKEATNHADAI